MAKGCLSSTQTDLVDAVREVLRHSAEPLTIPRIRERLPLPLGAIGIEELTDVLHRQLAAHVLVMCPKYRSSQDRYWDRPLREHAKVVLGEALKGGPMSWADLRKKFPKYLRHLADSVLNEELAKETIFRHPPASARMGPRYALEPADVRSYANKELREMLARLEQCGFGRAESREAIVQLLQEEEWAEYAVSKPASMSVGSDWWEKTMS
jgi:hypothetical protein